MIVLDKILRDLIPKYYTNMREKTVKNSLIMMIIHNLTYI